VKLFLLFAPFFRLSSVSILGLPQLAELVKPQSSLFVLRFGAQVRFTRTSVQ